MNDGDPRKVTMTSESGENEFSVALCGNPNVGKTTLFNALVSGKARVSNHPGITAEAQVATSVWGEYQVSVTDLPGCYSLSLDLPEAQLCRQYFDAIPPNTLVVCVLDAVSLRRNLSLLLECMEMPLPLMVVLTRIDEARLRGIEIDVEKLSGILGVPVAELPHRNSAKSSDLNKIMRTQFSEARESSKIEERVSWSEDLVAAVSRPVRPEEANRRRKREDRIDGILMHPVLGLVFFMLIMSILFGSVFWLAQIPMEWIDTFFAGAAEWVGVQLPPGDFRDLMTDGIIGGVSGTLIFLPQVLMLFFMISILEETGYLARAAFVADRWLRPFGLPGHSFVPLLSSHACAIPGILCTRLIPNRKDRLAAILVAPFMSCSARLPVYLLLVGILFPGRPLMAGAAFVGCYLLGALAAVISATLVRRFILPGPSPDLILELPPFQRPALMESARIALERGGMFIKNAGTVILLMCVILWWLGNYPFSDMSTEVKALRTQAEATQNIAESENLTVMADQLYARERTQASYLGMIGRTVEPVFAPIGADWQLSISVMASFAAREVFVSSLSVLLGSDEDAEAETIIDKISNSKRDDGSPLLTISSSAGLLVFFVLAMQCLPTLAVTRQETGSWKWALLQFVWMSLLAWSLAALLRGLLIMSGWN